MTSMYRHRGEPLRLPTPGKNVKVAVSGALRWAEGPFAFAQGGRSVNTELFLKMLSKLERRVHRTGRRIVLVLDNGKENTSWLALFELERLRPEIKVYRLPRYTSEQLNYVEGIWKHLEEDYFSRMLTSDPRDFPEAVRRLLGTLRKPKAIRSLLKPRHRSSVIQDLLVVA